MTINKAYRNGETVVFIYAINSNNITYSLRTRENKQVKSYITTSTKEEFKKDLKNIDLTIANQITIN